MTAAAPSSSNKVVKIAAIFFILGFSFFVLKELQSILLPLFIAVIIALLFEPFYEYLKTKKVPAGLAILIIIIIIGLLLAAASAFIATSVNSFIGELPKYLDKLDAMISQLGASLKIPKNEVANFKNSLKFTSLLKNQSIPGYLSSAFASIAGVFTDFILILIYISFILSELSSIKKRILKAFSTERATALAININAIFVDIRSYLIGKTLINLIHATAITILLLSMGIDFAIFWGLLTFFLNFIPSFGSLIATIFPFLTALLQFDSLVMPLILLSALVALAQIAGNIIEPKVLGDRLDLSPILLILSLIFWGYVWGIMGMILSVPIMSMIKIVLMNSEKTKPIGILMSYNLEHVKDSDKKTAERIRNMFKKKALKMKEEEKAEQKELQKAEQKELQKAEEKELKKAEQKEIQQEKNEKK
ncbi:AI-2E family transporter [soil metagenome]